MAGKSAADKSSAFGWLLPLSAQASSFLSRVLPDRPACAPRRDAAQAAFPSRYDDRACRRAKRSCYPGPAGARPSAALLLCSSALLRSSSSLLAQRRLRSCLRSFRALSHALGKGHASLPARTVTARPSGPPLATVPRTSARDRRSAASPSRSRHRQQTTPMRTKAVPLRAPRKTDAWRAKRVVFPARTFPAADLPRATSRQVQFDSPQPATTAAEGPPQSVSKKKKEKGGGRRRLARVCKDKPGNDATERAAPDKPIPSKPAATSTPSTASSPPPTARGSPPRTERTSSQSRSSAGASPPRAAPVADLPPDLHRLVHPSSAVLGEPTDKPGRGAYRSCDPCSKRREKVSLCVRPRRKTPI